MTERRFAFSPAAPGQGQPLSEPGRPPFPAAAPPGPSGRSIATRRLTDFILRLTMKHGRMISTRAPAATLGSARVAGLRLAHQAMRVGVEQVHGTSVRRTPGGGAAYRGFAVVARRGTTISHTYASSGIYEVTVKVYCWVSRDDLRGPS